MSSLKFPGIRGKLREKLDWATTEKVYPKFSIREPRHFIDLPHFKQLKHTNVTYPLLEPFVRTSISWDPKQKHLVYRVTEPSLTAKEEKILKKIEASLTEMIDIKISEMSDPKATLDYIEGKVSGVLNDLGVDLDPRSYLKIIYFIFRNFIGLNDIEPLMHDPFIEDIGCTGLDTKLYITHRRFGPMITNISYPDFDMLNNFVIKLSERCGRYISYAMPLLDGTLPDGSRVQASMSKDVTTKGPTFSIRRFRKNPFSPIDLMNFNTLSPDVLAYLWLLVEHQASLLVAGGVATGKTTFLNMISMFIPPERKVVSIEDVREINIPHENWIPATTRSGFGVPEEGGRRYGEVQMFDLLKESFRMKPDYVIVGEVRGKEAYVMFQGMASGNPSLGTIHSGSVDDVMKRLQTPPIEISPSLIESLDAVVVMVNARERGKSARRVKEIVEIESINQNTGKANSIKAFSWIPSQDDFRDNTSQSLLLRKIAFEKGVQFSEIVSELERRKKVIQWMQAFDVAQFQDVSALIHLYTKDPAQVMEWVTANEPPSHTTKTKEELWSATGLKILEAR